MATRTLKLAVVKADGTIEEYFHTKVVGALVNALSTAGITDIKAAEELAEAVTFYLYNLGSHRNITTSEVLSVIETVLASTGFEEAAVALTEHHFERKLKRCRLEVVKGRLHELSDAEELYKDDSWPSRSRWDKSRIIEDLIAEHQFDRQTARAVASMVEEKVFKLMLPVVPASLVRQLVLSDAAACIRAKQQLQSS